MNNEELITKIRTDKPEADKQDFNPANFQVSKSTQQTCTEFLKENDVEIDSWIEDLDTCDQLKKILKIFFTLSSSYNNEEWCQFPNILDDDKFYEGAKQALKNDAV